MHNKRILRQGKPTRSGTPADNSAERYLILGGSYVLLRSRGTAREESHQNNRRREGHEEQKFCVSHSFSFFDIRGLASTKLNKYPRQNE